MTFFHFLMVCRIFAGCVGLCGRCAIATSILLRQEIESRATANISTVVDLGEQVDAPAKDLATQEPLSQTDRTVVKLVGKFEAEYQLLKDTLVYVIMGLILCVFVGIFCVLSDSENFGKPAHAIINEILVMLPALLLFQVICDYSRVVMIGGDQLLMEKKSGTPTSGNVTACFLWFFICWIVFNVKYLLLAHACPWRKALIGKLGSFTIAFFSLQAWGNVLAIEPWAMSQAFYFVVQGIFIGFALALRRIGNSIRRTSFGKSWMEEDTMTAWTSGYMVSQFFRFCMLNRAPSMQITGDFEDSVSCGKGILLIIPFLILPPLILVIGGLRKSVYYLRIDEAPSIILLTLGRSLSVAFSFVFQSFAHWMLTCDGDQGVEAEMITAFSKEALFLTPVSFFSCLFFMNLSGRSIWWAGCKGLAEGFLLNIVLIWATLISNAFLIDAPPSQSSDKAIKQASLMKFLLAVIGTLVWGYRILPHAMASTTKVTEHDDHIHHHLHGGHSMDSQLVQGQVVKVEQESGSIGGAVDVKSLDAGVKSSSSSVTTTAQSADNER